MNKESNKADRREYFREYERSGKRREYHREYYEKHRETWNIPAWMIKEKLLAAHKQEPPEDESKEQKVARLLTKAVYIRRAKLNALKPRAERFLGWEFSAEEVAKCQRLEREALVYMLERSERLTAWEVIRYTHIPWSITCRLLCLLGKPLTIETLDQIVAMVKAKEKEEAERMRTERKQREKKNNATKN